jgi:hypothetical protein
MPSGEMWIAECRHEQAQQLMPYDHHHVRIGGLLAILITYHWMETTLLEEPLFVKAVFHDAALQHPPARDSNAGGWAGVCRNGYTLNEPSVDLI